MKKSAAFPSKYASQADFEMGPKVLTIASVRMEELQSDDGTEEKPIMAFQERGSKPMVLNNWNWRVAQELYGPDSDDWTGHRVKVWADPNVYFGKERKGGVRVLPPEELTPVEAAAIRGTAAPTRPPAVLTWNNVVLLAAAAGISEDALKIALAAKGATKATTPTEWTPMVHAILAEQRQPGDEPKHTGMDEPEASIPF